MELKELVKDAYYYDKTGMLLMGDCLEWMEKFPDKSIDMILTDLPYGTTRNKWDIIISFDKLWKEYNRICKNNAIIALMGSQPFTSMIVISNFDYCKNFPKEKIASFKHEWIWIKNRGSNFANTVREPFKEHESILIFSKGKWIYNKQMQERTENGKNRIEYNFNSITQTENYGKFYKPPKSKAGIIQKNKGGKKGNGENSENYGDFEGKDVVLSELRVPSSWQKFNTEVGLHPTQKPVKLFEYLIKTYTNENMIILDNAAGSCTTAIAAKNTNRRWICIEKEEKYCEISKKRLENWQKVEKNEEKT